MKSLEKKVKICYETAPFPDNLRRAEYFDKELARTVKWIKFNLQFLSKNITRSRPEKILCAGCGTGEESISLAKIFPNATIQAIDISDNSLKIARTNTQKAKVKNITYRKCSILQDLPHLKDRYDLIYCAGVIHHLSNPKRGFDILADKLKDNGKIVVMLYNSYGLFFYKCQLALLGLLAGTDRKKRLSWISILGFGKQKGKSEIYDSYINPQIQTFSIENIKSWARSNNLIIAGIVPPLKLYSLVQYAIAGQNYIFRRKTIFTIALKSSKLLFSGRLNTKKDKLTLSLPKITFFQLIFLFLGKGECQYLLKRHK